MRVVLLLEVGTSLEFMKGGEGDRRMKLWEGDYVCFLMILNVSLVE
jgi:hypothetical protein